MAQPKKGKWPPPSLKTLLNAEIDAPSERWHKATWERIRQHAKPRGSLGRLEELACVLAACQHTGTPCVKPRVALMFCADHGVAEEHVSVFPPETTCRVAAAAVAGTAGINALAREVSCDVQVVDAGMRLAVPGTLQTPSRRGTASIASGPAMSSVDAAQSIMAGVRAAGSAIEQGYRAIVVGEMGNSNTTIASALLTALTDLPLEAVVGRGTGISDVVLMKKIQVIHKALELNQPNSADPLDCLAKVGGLELGAMTGAMIAAAAKRTPCVVDGFIASVSALLALRLQPQVHPYLIFSHLSPERGHLVLLEQLNITPLLRLGLCLGEGTGGIACLPLLDLACALIHGIATFAECNVPSPYDLGCKQ